jgi:LysR family glycine cleavage system transcriptional activator
MAKMPRAVSRRAYDVPPLELLVAFEAAARHLSFTRAGDEIALTQSAVSRQIQALEERLGVSLFRRLHRALVLTEEGRVFQQATTEALTAIDRASRALRPGGETRPVVISTTAGFAGLWLIPRLSSFVAARPEIDVRISTGNGLANFDRDGVDVAVRYRSVDLLPAGALPLFGETVLPVCSPRLLRAAGTTLRVPADLAGQTLLRMEPDGSNQLQDWGLWLHAMHLTHLKPAGVLHFSSYDQLVQAAVAGQGVALGRVPLIDRLLKAKKLVAPFADAVVSPRGYCMLVGPGSARRPEVGAFTAWLAAEARAPGSAGPRGRARA